MIVTTRLGAAAFDEAGSGVPVLLLHGFPLDRTLWSAQLSSPPPGARLIALDLPGYGESAAADIPSLDHWADWTMAVVDALGLERVVVCGLSMGGYLTFSIWRRHRERVRALVLADTRAGADNDEGKAKRLDMQKLAREAGAGAIAERMMPGMVGKTTRETKPHIVDYMDAMMRNASVQAIHDSLDAMRQRVDSTPTLATIDVPTLIVCGDEDALTPVKESEAMHLAIPKSQLAIIPSAGHVSNIEHPAAFNALLSGFLTANVA